MNIINRIYKSLNVLENERTAISLLLAHSFFIGVFLSYYLAYANGVFLKTFKPEFLPYTYVLSGIAGFIASAIFSNFQKKTSYSNVVMGTLVSVFIMIVLFIIGIWVLGEVDWLVFLMFVGLIPVFGLVAVQYGGMTMKLFDLRQGKRLFGVIASGEVVSSMIWFFTIPIILQFLPATWYLLILALIGLSLGVFFQWIIVTKFKDKLGGKPEKTTKKAIKGEPKKKKGSIGALLKNRYFTLIFFLMIFSTLARVFVDYSFMGIARETFQTSLTSFFAIFFGLLKVVELLTNTFIAGRLLSRYGVKLGLIILPFLLSIFAVIGIVSYWVGAASMVFLALAMNKLFDKTVRTSLEVPSFKTLFQPLDEDTKFMVQAQVEGNASQMAVFIAGGLLILFNFIFPDFTIMQSTYFLCLILIVWLFFARNTIKEYRNIVVQKLYDYKPDVVEEHHVRGVEQGFQKDIDTQNKTFQFLERYNPISLLSYLSSALHNGTSQMKERAFNIIDKSKLKRFEEDLEGLSLETDKSYELKELLQDFRKMEALSEKTIVEYINSNDNQQRLFAIQSFDRLKKYDLAYLSEKLIQDSSKEAVLATLSYVGEQNDSSLYERLVKNLDGGYSGRLSYFQLLRAKVDTSEALNQAFNQFELENRLDVNKHIRLIKILKILRANGSAEAQQILLSKISYGDYEVRRFAIDALYELDFQAGTTDRLTVKQAIQSVTRHCTWLIATKLDILREGKNATKVFKVISYEFQYARQEIFTLLSFIYEKEAIQQIMTNLNSNLPEREVLAIEMTDILLDEDIKEVVFPLIDRISELERLKQLYTDYPQVKYDYANRLKDIINYDFSRIGTWTKCTAIQALSQEVEKIPLEIIAHVYNPDPALRELAFVNIFEKNEKEYYKYIGHENPRAQIRLNRVVGLLPNEHHLQTAFEKVAILKAVRGFQTLQNDLLLKIATVGQSLKLIKGESLKPHRKLKNVIYLVLNGVVRVTKNYEITEYKTQELIGLYEAISLRECQLTGVEESHLIYFDVDAFLELMQVYEDLEGMIYQYFLKTPSEEEEIKEEEEVQMEWRSSSTGI